MAWVGLVTAGVLEVVWAVALKQSDGLTRPLPAALAIAAAVASFVLLSVALRSIPVGTGYAVWVGIGAFGVGVAGVVSFGEDASPARLGLLALVLVAVVGLGLRRAGTRPADGGRADLRPCPAMTGRQPYLASRLQGFGTTIFAEMSALAARTGAINLGQGFPDTDGPAEVSEAAIAAIRAGHNQYPPGPGISELRAAVAGHQRRFWALDVDPDTEVLVTAGATEAITAALLALCEVGDEVLTFEPTYDSYRAAAAMAGATLRVVTLRPPGYDVDLDALARAVTPRTRLVLLNSPHNPTGKVFGDDELAAVARLCVEHDLVAVTDEVYEHMVFEGAHRPLASLPGMAERTLTVSSAGKTFSFTGWKVGWACGPEPLVTAVRTAKQFLTYVNGAPFQHAVVTGLGLGDGYFAGLRDDLRAKRDVLCAGLESAGFTVFRPGGTYFVTADIRPLGGDDGLDFCRSLPERCGVVAVPNAVFYEDPERGRHLVRFTFCKRREVLAEAAERLATLA